MAQTVKHLSTMWETGVQSLGWVDPLEKEMAIHSNTIAWKIPWTEEPGRLQSMGSQSETRLSDFIHSFLTVLGLCCCSGFSLVAVNRDYSLIVVLRLLTAVTSLVKEHWALGCAEASVIAVPWL